MAQYRKPIPKTQREISKNLQTPSDIKRGNPNSGVNPNESETGISFNRSEKLSFTDDNTKPLSIGIKDLDEAVFFYFENIIKPFIYQNGQRRNVPIIYGSPERWKSFQRDGYYRDKGGSVMLPIIILKRDSIAKDRTVANKLDANGPNLYGTFSKGYNPKNTYNNFSILNNRKPTKQFHAVAVPDYVTLEYSCIIQTYYMEQLNKIIESIEYASDAYWGNPERFKFRAFIDNFTTATELTKGQDRLVKGTFNIRLRGYIIPDTIQKDLNSIKKYNSKSKITISSETTSNSEIFEIDTPKPLSERTYTPKSPTTFPQGQYNPSIFTGFSPYATFIGYDVGAANGGYGLEAIGSITDKPNWLGRNLLTALYEVTPTTWVLKFEGNLMDDFNKFTLLANIYPQFSIERSQFSSEYDVNNNTTLFKYKSGVELDVNVATTYNLIFE